MDRWIHWIKDGGRRLREALSRGAFSISLACCLLLVGGAAYYARNMQRVPTPAAPQSTVSPVAMTPDSVDRLEDMVMATPASEPIWPVSSRQILTAHDEQSPQWSETLGQWAIHAGIDIQAAPGEAVLATISGSVTQAYKDALLGYTVEIAGEDGYIARYANLGTLLLVTPGDRVQQGQPIGSVGTSAPSESAMAVHLHYELRKDGEWALADVVTGAAEHEEYDE